MTREQEEKILKALGDDRNIYANECNRRIEREYGKIEGADYMIQLAKKAIEKYKTGGEDEKFR